MKKLLAIVISMAMLVAMMPMGVFAETPGELPSGGSIHTESGIIAAHLTDNATDNPINYDTLNEGYNLDYNKGTITINVKGKLHKNGKGDVGKWVGIAVPIHSEATSLVWNVNGGEDKPSDLTKKWTKEGIDYKTLYWAYDKTDVQKIKYTFKKDNTVICSEELNVVVNATGDTDVAKIGNRYFGTLQEAIDAEGNTIEVAEIASINSGNATIDLKGKTLVTRQIATTVISGGAELHIINGTINAPNAADDNLKKGTNALFNVQTASKLFVDGMKINTTGSALFPQGSAASVDVNNSTINAGVYAVGTNASTDDNYKVVITLKDSTFNVSGYENNDNDSCAVMINVEGTLNINKCNITGGRQGVVVRAGTAKIENSRITNNCTYKGSDKDLYDNADWGTGNNLPMAGLLVGNYKKTAGTAYKKVAVTTVTDTIISVPRDSNKPAILVADNADYEAVLNLGGTNTNVTGDIATKTFAKSGSKLAITGGTFSTSPKAYVAGGNKVYKFSDTEYKVSVESAQPSAPAGYRWKDATGEDLNVCDYITEVIPYTPSTPATPADNVTNNTTDKSTTADLTPAVKDNKAETTVDAKTADKIVDKAVANKSTEVIVDATGNNTVASSEVGIPEKTVKELAEKTDANLVIKTDNGKVDLDKTAVKALADQAGTTGTVKLIVETVKNDADICHVNLKLITSNGAVKDFRGGNVKVTINLTKELAAKELVCVYIDDNGIYTLVDGVLNADGTYTFTTGHFSEYAVMAKAEADKKIAEQLNTLIKEVNLKVRTSKTAKKNIKAVVSGDITALTDAGYTVKYKFYRSTKKASKYKAVKTKDTNTYINTAGKKGTKYYYKAKALVYDGDKLVGQTVLKQCKYGVRTWSK